MFSLGFISISYAEELDLISLVTHGKLNENSLGVRVLNDEEMRKVVGGLYEIGNRVITPTLVSKYYIVQNSDLNNDGGLIREAKRFIPYCCF
ncbi:hypothetical protein [Helicobacter turcicus]|uniref:Uncharacterized protein n=1 Tax=Helicobacter turcicus TaxID=2867412 RepID=A0ABS7JNQ5_9HELI|nr:hypothetical protein [Helicobacter turcicus]MBX7491023.1 hypothetical protein [Helicobacter turcicus]MBX7545850.1 hypothetical protein [Helicobacter turcicus]